jgi:hypothetical protein
MKISLDEAAEMYAACRAWYGPRAKGIVHKKIKQLERQGDHAGVAAWTAVARQLSRMPPGYESSRSADFKPWRLNKAFLTAGLRGTLQRT